MIAVAAILANSVVTLANPITVARPATTWSCDFTDVDAASFTLSGFFAEAPVGSDPNAPKPTKVEGSGPARLLGEQMYNAFEAYSDARTYMIHRRDKNGSSETVLLNLIKDNNIGLAAITRYVPDQANGRGKLHAFANGHCSATFHPPGYKGVGK